MDKKAIYKCKAYKALPDLGNDGTFFDYFVCLTPDEVVKAIASSRCLQEDIEFVTDGEFIGKVINSDYYGIYNQLFQGTDGKKYEVYDIYNGVTDLFETEPETEPEPKPETELFNDMACLEF